jgi:hypothetical protein
MAKFILLYMEIFTENTCKMMKLSCRNFLFPTVTLFSSTFKFSVIEKPYKGFIFMLYFIYLAIETTFIKRFLLSNITSFAFKDLTFQVYTGIDRIVSHKISNVKVSCFNREQFHILISLCYFCQLK